MNFILWADSSGACGKKVLRFVMPLDGPRAEEAVYYDDGNRRFATGTYDPTAQFRAAKVVEFFNEQGLTPAVLRQQYLKQITMLREEFRE